MNIHHRTVSVAMTTYNGQHYIREQLDSILEQTYIPDEIIIVDDCSSDATMEILNTYARAHYDIMKIYQNESNLGYIKNFEKAISLCSSQYIALSDQDDIWMHNKLEVLLNGIGDSLLIHSDAHIIDAEGNILKKSYSKSARKRTVLNYFDMVYFNSVTGCTTLFKRELFSMTAPFPEIMPHDWWLGMVAVFSDSIEYCSDPLIMYRQHESNAIGSNLGHKSFKRILHSIFRKYAQIIYRRNNKIRKIRRNMDLLVSRNIEFNGEIEDFYRTVTKLDSIYSSGTHCISITACCIWLRNCMKLSKVDNESVIIHMLQSIVSFLCYDWYTKMRTKKSNTAQG